MKQLSFEKFCQNFGYVFFALLLVLNCILMEYRLADDSSIYYFNILTEKWFVIEHERYFSYFTQWIPVLLVQFKTDPLMVLYACALNEWLIHFLCFILISKGLKNPVGALSVCFLIMVSKWNYFNPVSELINSGSLFAFLYFLLKYNVNKENKIFYAIIPIIILVFSHPLYFFLVPAILTFSFGENIFLKKNFIRYALMITITGVLSVFRYFTQDSYDKGRILLEEGGPKSFFSFDPGYIYHQVLPSFDHHGLLKLLFIPILFLSLTIVYLFWKKNYILLVFLLLFSIPFVFVIFNHFGNLLVNKDLPTFERYFFVVFLPAIPLFFDYCLSGIQSRFFNILRYGFVILMAAEFYFLTTLFHHHRYIHDLIDKMVYNISGYPEHMFGVTYGHFGIADSRIDGAWALPCRTGLMSSLRFKNAEVKQVICLDLINTPIKDSLNEKWYIYRPWWLKGVNDANPEYIKGSGLDLKLMNSIGNQQTYPDSFFKKVEILSGGPYQMRYSTDKLLLPVTIVNSNLEPVFSECDVEGSGPFVSYHWYQNGNLVVHEGLRTPIMMDVKGAMQQYFWVQPPPKPGVWELKMDILYENIRWTNCLGSATYNFLEQ